MDLIDANTVFSMAQLNRFLLSHVRSINTFGGDTGNKIAELRT